MRKWRLPLSLVAAALLGSAVLWGLKESEASRALPKDLVLSDITGQPVNLQTYQGQPLVINFWATWCPPCVREMPLLAEYAQQDGVTVVLINQGENVETIQAYLDQAGLSFEHMLLDPRQTALQAMQVRGLPTTLFFDAQGRLLNEHLGEVHEPQLQAFMQQQLK